MSTSMRPATTSQHLIGAIGIAVATASAHADPGFSATYDVTALLAQVDWSSDLGPGVVDVSRNFRATAQPLTRSVIATRNGRTIGASITQTAPYVLADAYWAASWTGSMEVPGPGIYGLFANARTQGLWNFALPGQTYEENMNTTFYYAALWDIDSPADIGPSFSLNGGPSRPLSGSETGSFTLAAYRGAGIPGYLSGPDFSAGTRSGDNNLPGQMIFSFQLAFATTPIDSSVFAPVPEPASWALMMIGVAGTLAARRRSTTFGRR